MRGVDRFRIRTSTYSVTNPYFFFAFVVEENNISYTEM